jgi:hypothetical protein
MPRPGSFADEFFRFVSHRAWEQKKHKMPEPIPLLECANTTMHQPFVHQSVDSVFFVNVFHEVMPITGSGIDNYALLSTVGFFRISTFGIHLLCVLASLREAFFDGS